jgi:chemotaxis signal transduction protein
VNETAQGAVADEQPGDEVAAATDAIVMRLGGGRFAVELSSVAEVGRAPSITRVPGLPVWLAGVANWRGRILPVLDIRGLLGATVEPQDHHARLLVLAEGSIVAGMLVDAVEGTTTLSDVAAFPPVRSPTGAGLLSGQVPRDDGPIAVLDVAAVLRLREGLPRGRRTA